MKPSGSEVASQADRERHRLVGELQRREEPGEARQDEQDAEAVRGTPRHRDQPAAHERPHEQRVDDGLRLARLRDVRLQGEDEHGHAGQQAGHPDREQRAPHRRY